jgi:hypothetical protein
MASLGWKGLSRGAYVLDPKMFTIIRAYGYKYGGVYGNTIKTGR